MTVTYTVDDLYKDFSIPLSEIRSQWPNWEWCSRHQDGPEPHVALGHYVDWRKLQHVEHKFLALMNECPARIIVGPSGRSVDLDELIDMIRRT